MPGNTMYRMTYFTYLAHCIQYHDQNIVLNWVFALTDGGEEVLRGSE